MIDFQNAPIFKLSKVDSSSVADSVKDLLIDGETAGTFDFDSELELYFSGVGRVKFEFSGRSDIVRIGNLISQYTLR